MSKLESFILNLAPLPPKQLGRRVSHIPHRTMADAFDHLGYALWRSMPCRGATKTTDGTK
jgi:hypothetical protein